MGLRRDKRRYGRTARDVRRGGRGAPFTPTIPTTKIIDTWIRINGVDVAGSNSRKSYTDLTFSRMMTSSHIVELAAGDYCELMFAVNDLNVNLSAIGATGYGPATSALTAIVTEVRK